MKCHRLNKESSTALCLDGMANKRNHGTGKLHKISVDEDKNIYFMRKNFTQKNNPLKLE